MARKHLCSKSQYNKIVLGTFCPPSQLLKCITKLVGAVFSLCATPLRMMTGTFPSVSHWYLCLLKWIILLRVCEWPCIVSMGLSLSLARESQHQINCMGTTYWKATGREKGTETQAIGTRMLRWDIYQDSLAHITTGRSEGDWKKQKLGEKDIWLFSFHCFAFSKHCQVFK